MAQEADVPSPTGEDAAAPSGELAWLAGDARQVAPRLLGWRLESVLDGVPTSGRIVETEAYPGPFDEASHAAARIGRTSRNASMFGPAGTAYVYRSYGMHWCVNVVTHGLHEPSAVLIRALEPLEGVRAMERRRGGRYPLASGPGRLCQALGLHGGLDGHPLSQPPLRLLPPLSDGRVSRAEVLYSGRVGVTRARDALLRFFLEDNPHVSPPRRGERMRPASGPRRKLPL
ncbi:MAG: DNA-3-methyladenine glycosylase [Gemmatimonadota bacterium]